MSCFLFQNSILGNDPLGKTITLLNPCENQPFELPWMSLPPKACAVFGWHCGDRAAGTEHRQHWGDRRCHGSMQSAVGTFVCTAGSNTDLAGWARACASSGCCISQQHSSVKTQPHRNQWEEEATESTTLNNSPNYPGSCLCLYHLFYAPDKETTMFTQIFAPQLCWQVLFFQVPGIT